MKSFRNIRVLPVVLIAIFGLAVLKIGDTLPLEMRADALVAVRCGSVTLTEGRMGRVGDRVAIRVTKQLRRPNTTFAMFEKADEQTKLMEAQ